MNSATSSAPGAVGPPTVVALLVGEKRWRAGPAGTYTVNYRVTSADGHVVCPASQRKTDDMRTAAAALLGALLAVIALTTAPTASAHATRIGTDPAVNAVLTTGPSQVSQRHHVDADNRALHPRLARGPQVAIGAHDSHRGEWRRQMFVEGGARGRSS